jgi:arylsulfatase A-like enzyme
MKNNNYFKLLLLGALGPPSAFVSAQKITHPNVLIILADDLGHGDLSCTLGKTPTPNIDKIFAQGIRFGNFMTCMVSSPTRAGLLTAMNPLRTGQGPNTDGNLDPNIPNLGNYFQKEGYKTGLFGKWHNSPSPRVHPEAISVNKYGFDRFVGFYAGGIDYFTKGYSGWFHDDKLIEDELDYSTDLISKYAIDFMDKSHKENMPFLCYVPFNAVHAPLDVKKEDLKRVPESIRSKIVKMRNVDQYHRLTSYPPEIRKYNQVRFNDATWELQKERLTRDETALLYSAVLISLDDNVGKIMDYLKQTNQLENTIVLYFSDNGGTPDAGNNYPFKGFKHSTDEGGIHSAAAMIIPKWVLPDPKKDVNEMTGYLDMFPTLAELTKTKQPLPANLDGKSIVDKLKGTSNPQTDRYFYWSWRDHDVVRTDKWKLSRYFDKVELYDMVNDISETLDVSASNPEIVKQLMKQVDIESRKIGVANAFLPLKIKHENPKPSGSAIAIEFDIKSADDQNIQTIQILNKPFNILADYYIEYDIKVDGTATPSICFFSPLKANKTIFEGKQGVDLNGKLVQSPTTFDSNWKHVAVGLCAFAPLGYNQFGLTFKFKSLGKATVYIDNVLIKNTKGEIIQEIFVDKFDKKGFKSPNVSVVKL